MTTPSLSVIVPCYNEERALSETIISIRRSLGDTLTYEILMVNDGSTDRSGRIMEELAEKDSRLRVVHHERNQGYGAALKTGIRRARSDLIAITDADGTYPNERLPELVELAREADMVVGARIGENVKYPLIRKIPKWFLKAYGSWIVGQDIPDLNSGLRVFHKPVVERFMSILPNTFSFTTTITLALMQRRYDVRFVPISYSPRIGKSKIRPIRDTLLFFQLILRTGMYFAPLRVLMPLVSLLLLSFTASASYDVFVLSNLTDRTVLLLMFTLNTGLFALLADMIDKRSSG